MAAKQSGMSRKRRNSSPLNQTTLHDLALSYLARFSTSAAKLENYLYRKIRERGVDDAAGDLDVGAIVERMVELRYVDDEAYAQARSSGLLRKGYGARRVEQALRGAGIAEHVRSDVAPDEYQARNAAVAIARKRGFGPFSRSDEQIGLKLREKQIAAMIRAGHTFDAAKAIIDAKDIDTIETWLEEARECDF